MANERLKIVASQLPDRVQLLEQCKGGNRQAQGQFYHAYRSEIARNLHRIMGPNRRTTELEDVLQDVFMEVFRSIASFRGEAQFTTWLYRVCINVALQRMRKAKRLREIPAAKFGDTVSEATPERNYTARCEIDAVYRLLDHLSDKKRVVFILHEIEGRQPREIAELVGAPVLTVRTRLHYARKEFYVLAASDDHFAGTRGVA